MNLEILNDGTPTTKPWLNPIVYNLTANTITGNSIVVPGLAKQQFSQSTQINVFNTVVEQTLASAFDASGSMTIQNPLIQNGNLTLTMIFELIGSGADTATLRFYVNGAAVITFTPLTAQVANTSGKLTIYCNIGNDYINYYGELNYNQDNITQESINGRTLINRLGLPLVLDVTTQNSDNAVNMGSHQLSVITIGLSS